MHPRILPFCASLLLIPGATDARTPQRCVGSAGEPVFAQYCASGKDTSQASRPASRRAHRETCARTPQELQQQVRDALRTRNGIRLSGLVLWRGYSARTARSELRQLLGLLKPAFKDVAIDAGESFIREDIDGGLLYESVSAPGLVVLTTNQAQGTLASSERRFGITRDHGCYWMTLYERPARYRIRDADAATASGWIPTRHSP
ncbi:hypothetical protein [Tahibacter amnicola]|uniref:Uncharacterized protein n=1 Tax=Tahibacter amnicola TaxID=2976241 RepID=A0ABY6BNE9_9GAMM|nr:hypothetical protein [Tahibacter amnicola]UXI70091.1 hypothetical protein N4264_10820 [Tahibacter amnicola]